jgi:hypothetical protein
MDQKEKLREMILRIIKSEFTDDFFTYEAIEDFSFDRLFKENSNLQDLFKEENGHNEFFSEVGEVLSSLSLLAGTIKTYLEIRKILKERAKRKTADLDIETKWAADLVKNGIAKERADEMAKKYSTEFVLLINSDEGDGI